MKILALTTSHNRRESTVRSLRQLLTQRLPPGWNLDICLVDDGSNDGTADTVRTSFPSVKVLDGTGYLFWAGGMRFGWEEYGVFQEADYLVAFNDDIELRPDALEVCLAAAIAVEARGCNAYAIAGAFVDPSSSRVAYGAVRRSSWWHPLRFRQVAPTGELEECETLNMNFALISRAALKLVGFLSPEFTHGKADFDFGLRLREAGGRILLTPGYVGRCGTNQLTGTSLQRELTFTERWIRLTGIKEQPPKERLIYYRRHGSGLWFVLWSLPYIRVALESAIRVVRSCKTRFVGVVRRLVLGA